MQKPIEERAISLNYVSAPTITTLEKMKTERKANMLRMNDQTAEDSYKNKQQRLKNISDLKHQQEQRMLEQQQRNLKENAEKEAVKQKQRDIQLQKIKAQMEKAHKENFGIHAQKLPQYADVKSLGEKKYWKKQRNYFANPKHTS